ncbi:helix-turn-helix domain-containing protein [Streptomyces sp. NPDC006463]|uniref:helix-turn-helix domain-containing protein n=1 Tax=Streptomyces sp. NPDC006463 TaxID=3364746 RepID=UPI00368DF3BA
MSESSAGHTEGNQPGPARTARARQQFADRLTEFKDRRGYSYESLARKAHMSRSSVHRYCRGIVIPVEFGTAEKIARLCGASPRELADLYRLWVAASAAESDPGPDPAGGEGAETGERAEGADVAGPAPQPVPPPAPRRAARRPPAGARFAVASFALVLLSVVSLSGSVPAPRRAATAPPTSATAAPWTQVPTPVSNGIFGMTLNSSTGAMPTFQIDTVRLWDSRTRWSNIQPRRGVYDWSVLDRLVTAANEAGLPVLFTMGGTPDWASPGGPHTAYDDGSRTSPPDDLADWTAFVAAVAGRYRGRIDAYELWVMGNDPRYFSGSLETLVEMTRSAKAVLDAVDPDATVVCPSMGRLWEAEGMGMLERFSELRGYDSCDVAGVKLYQRTASDPPEQMLGLVGEIDRAFHRGGSHPKLWSTGTTYDIMLEKPLEEPAASANAVRFFLVGLYARYQRMYFYNWGGVKIPIVMQPEGQPPTRAALYVEELRRWVHGTRIHSCGNGLAAGLPVGVWQCRFDRDGTELAIVWAPTGTARLKAPRGVSAVRHLDGTTSPVGTDGTVEVTALPVLLTTTR